MRRIMGGTLLVLIVFSTLLMYQTNKEDVGKTSEAGQVPDSLSTSSTPAPMEWNKNYGGTSDDVAGSMVRTSDGGYATAGWTGSFGAGDFDFWAVWPPTEQSHAEIIVLTTTGSTVTISNPNIPTQYGTVSPNAPYILVLDPWADALKSSFLGGVKNNAIHITATAYVTVLFRIPSSGSESWADTDIYQVLPTTMLGSEYYSLSYTPLGQDSWYVAIATEASTLVTYQVTPNSNAYATVLNQWDTLTCASGQNYQDMTGCHVYTLSTAPIGFVSGAYANIPQSAYAADMMMEMLLPVEQWRSDYSVAPLAESQAGDVIRIQASQANTVVSHSSVLGTGSNTIDAGQYVEISDSIYTQYPIQIHSSAPVQVEQYAKSKYEYWPVPLAGVGDPLEMTIIPTARFSSRYTFYSPTWTNGPSEGAFVTIIAPNTLTTAYLDSMLVAWALDPYIGKYATIQVAEGQQHYVKADNPIGVYSYGYEDVGAYGYPGGPVQIVGGGGGGSRMPHCD
jgi:hypothetical protein